MHERLTNEETIKNAERRIRELIEAHGEWLYAQDGRGGVLLQKGECDFRVSHHRLLFSCWTNQGLIVWRINGWEWTGQKLLLEASRRMGAERARLELIPRASVSALTASISDSRRERCYRIANLACASLTGAKVERAGLSAGARSSQPGRYARILLRYNLERIAVAGTVASAGSSDAAPFLSSTLIWFTRACERARPPYIRKLWLITEKDCAESLAKLLALLRDDLRRVIKLFQIDDEWQTLSLLRSPELQELLSEPPQRFRRPPSRESLSESAKEIIALAPEAVDVVRARHGETLRYHGLAFARVRRLMGKESIWFGIDGAHRRLLDAKTKEEWLKLLRDLQLHRSAESTDTHHALYRASTEAWLESRLRRDVTRLDPGLRLAPLHAQFRPTHAGGVSRPIDLLALRQDGRLVVIELKVSEDREHVFQGADYWRRTELHRRHGHITRAHLFGDAFIADEPPLVYLVAPTLRFHPSFNLLARTLTPEIELYRFDLNENWRAGVRVVRRKTLANSL